MKNKVLMGRLVLLVVLALGAFAWVGCTPSADAGTDTPGESQDSGKGGPSDLTNGVDDNGTDVPGAEDTPEATETPDAQHGSEKVTGTVEAINGDTVTINGVTVVVRDPSLLDGINVGDTITVELETEDDGVVVLTGIEDESNDGPGHDATEDATDDNGNDATVEATDDNGEDLTPEATDDNGEDGTSEPGDDNGGNDNSGHNGGGSDDGGSHGGGGGGHDD